MRSSFVSLPRVRSMLPLAMASLLLTSWASTSSARLFLDDTSDHIELMPNGSGPGSEENGFYSIFPPNIDFFNLSQDQLGWMYVSVNGNIYFQSHPANDSEPEFLGESGYYQLSPLWKELQLGTNSKVLMDFQEGYQVFTWQNMELGGSSDGKTGSFQVLFIEETLTLNGVSLQRGDIIFSYDDLQFFNGGGEFFIGIQGKGASPGAPNPFAHDPDAPLGLYSSHLTGAFPYSDLEFLLFRRNNSDYEVIVESLEAIPEPSTIAALLSGSLLIGWQAFRRRRG